MAAEDPKSEAEKARSARAEVLERWSNDIDLFAGEVQMMHARRQVFDRYDAELEHIGEEEGSAGESALWFRYHFLRPTYGEAQAVAIRRLVDSDRRTRSFVRLLSEMIEHPEYLNRERYIELFFARREGERDEDDLRLAHDLFDQVAGRAPNTFRPRNSRRCARR